MTHDQKRKWLITRLLSEQDEFRNTQIPEDEENQKRLLRALMNIRKPAKDSEEFLNIQDEYLKEEIRRKNVTDFRDLDEIAPGIILWKWDITALKAGAIVNAANSKMLGCFHPNHGCIDNAIHTFAGVKLRKACFDLMQKNGGSLKTGQAVITEAFNLPAEAVIHTVGPIVYGKLTDQDRKKLAECYVNCLKLADVNGLKSIAFCCISTGEFHFPHEEAARIAIETVRRYKAQTKSELEVIFNVFKDEDESIYRRLIEEHQPD